ncbi:hypothetical protein HYQ44_010874 [Verticillium longisporum]|nr:hypothetical protein HYQ44_010874 [Verticillium longisporum]
MDQGTSQFSPSTVAGLEFYRLHVLQDTRIVSTLNSSFEWCAMGDYRRIREDQGHIFQLRRGGANADILVVQLWSAKSQATYYRAGCEARDITFEDGGLVIMDARVAFETRHGSPVTEPDMHSTELFPEHKVHVLPMLGRVRKAARVAEPRSLLKRGCY